MNTKPILDDKTFNIIQEELFPGVFGDMLHLPAIQAILEMAMYLGYDVYREAQKRISE